jgi:hypothetical protein
MILDLNSLIPPPPLFPFPPEERSAGDEMGWCSARLRAAGINYLYSNHHYHSNHELYRAVCRAITLGSLAVSLATTCHNYTCSLSPTLSSPSLAGRHLPILVEGRGRMELDRKKWHERRFLSNIFYD